MIEGPNGELKDAGKTPSDGLVTPLLFLSKNILNNLDFPKVHHAFPKKPRVLFLSTLHSTAMWSSRQNYGRT